MEQPLISTEQGGFSVRPISSSRGRNRGDSSILGRFRVTDSECRMLLAGVDTLLLLAGVLVAWRLVQPDVAVQAGIDLPAPDFGIPHWFWMGMLLGAWFVFGSLVDLYDVRTAHARVLSTVRVVIVDLLSVLAAMLFGLLFEIVFPGAFLLFYVCIGLLLVIAWRFTYAALSKTSIFVSRVAILGTGNNAQMVVALLDQEPGLHYEVSGFISDTPNPNPGAKVCGDLPVWHAPASLFELVRDLRVDTIVVATERELGPALYKELIACQLHGINVVSVPTMVHRLCQKEPVESVYASWPLEAIQTSSSKVRRLFKRTLDLCVSLLALPWFLLAFPLIALAIKLDSPGSIVYRQIRSGLGGKPFRILKFRTMFADAEKDGRARWAETGDPRITRVGRFLRKTRMDELPQLINILRGDMSLIGPRPERPEFVAQLEQDLPYFRARLLVPPGLTGWAQIKYTYGNSVEDALIKLQYDIYYVRHWSVWMDIYILFQTISVVLRARGT